MKKFAPVLFFIISISSLFAQQNDSIPAVSSENLAWKLMRIHPQEEKPMEIKAYEQILLRMRKGTSELALLMEEFSSPSKRKYKK